MSEQGPKEILRHWLETKGGTASIERLFGLLNSEYSHSSIASQMGTTKSMIDRFVMHLDKRYRVLRPDLVAEYNSRRAREQTEALQVMLQSCRAQGACDGPQFITHDRLRSLSAALASDTPSGAIALLEAGKHKGETGQRKRLAALRQLMNGHGGTGAVHRILVALNDGTPLPKVAKESGVPAFTLNRIASLTFDIRHRLDPHLSEAFGAWREMESIRGTLDIDRAEVMRDPKSLTAPAPRQRTLPPAEIMDVPEEMPAIPAPKRRRVRAALRPHDDGPGT